MNRLIASGATVGLLIGILAGFLWWGRPTQRLQAELRETRQRVAALEQQLGEAQAQTWAAQAEVKSLQAALEAMEKDLRVAREQRDRPEGQRVTALRGSMRRTRTSTFSVQVASFTSEQRASVLKDILDQTWQETYVQRVEVGGWAVFRVRVGHYATRQQAREAAQRLASAGYRVLVVEE